MTESPRVLQLRQELAELGEPEPGTADLAAATRASILAEMSDLGAPAVPPAEGPRPIPPAVRVHVHVPAPRPIPLTPLPAAPAAAEAPMPRAHENPTPRLATLLERLKGNLAAKKRKAASITRMSIRRHCALHGLPVPPEAAIQADTCPKKFRKAPKPLRTMPALAEGVMDFPGAPFARQTLQQMGDLGAPPSAAARLRALRSQALEVLPELEDLDPEAARLAHEELRLLSEALVLGSHIIDRRIA